MMRISDQQRRTLHLALASARNKLAQLHQRFALERIAALPDEEPAVVLREYDRTHSLGKAEAESLANRALASFGAPPANSSAQPLLAPPVLPPQPGGLRRFFARLLRRRQPELRTWLSLHAAHTEAVLLGAHAMHVIELLESIDGSIADVPSVVDFYVRETKTRGALREPITVIALDRLYRRRASGSESAVAPANGASTRPANLSEPSIKSNATDIAAIGPKPARTSPRLQESAGLRPANGATPRAAVG